MDEILMREYLRHKKGGMSDEDFMRRMKDHFGTRYAKGGRGMRDSRFDDFFEEDVNRRMYDDFYINRDRSEGDFMDMVRQMSHEDKKKLSEMLEGNKGEHFNESYAKYVVSRMYHTEGGRKYVGEKYDFNKAKDVCDRYRGIIPSSVTHADVYVAINSQYHDYCELFKAWFGDSVDTKIIESAINFWFKDDDFVDGNKVWMYFMDL